MLIVTSCVHVLARRSLMCGTEFCQVISYIAPIQGMLHMPAMLVDAPHVIPAVPLSKQHPPTHAVSDIASTLYTQN
jgi:hypothetical protein